MENDYKLRRHTELYESQNRQLKRIVLFGIVFAYIVLVNILKPYSDRVAVLQEDLKEGRVEVEKSKKVKEDLNELQNTFVSVQKVIEKSPWDANKNKLIRDYREMNQSDRDISMDEYQAKADATVKSIGKMVVDSVSTPLQGFLEEGFIANNSPSLYKSLKELPEVVATWTNQYKGEVWYRTLDDKNETVAGLTAALNEQLADISTEIDYADRMAKEQQRQLANRIETLQQEIDLEAKSLPEKLDAEMSKILPNWIGGIITFEQIMWYPFIVIGIVIYGIMLAFSLSKHYHFMIQGLQISDTSQGDAALSSLWTLTDRGKLGTIMTCYLGFIGLMWYFFEQGYVLFRESGPAETGQFFSETMMVFGLWSGRVLFTALLLLFIWQPFFKERYRKLFWK